MSQDLSQPITANERIVTLDVIRGVALLGILIMNIQTFAMVFAAYGNPTAYGDLSGINFVVYYLSHLFADQKFMTIFATLFGVGVVLMAENITQKGGRAAKVHYIRMFYLAVFGVLHAYLLWYGDILFAYALSGMLVFLARNKSPRFLIIFGIILIGITSLVMLAAGYSIPYWTAEDLAAMDKMWQPNAEQIQQEINANLASWFGAQDHRTLMASKAQQNVIFYLFRIVGLMMIGMALYKMQFFGERFTSRNLTIQGVLSIVIAAAVIAYGNQLNFANGWSMEAMFVGSQYNYWGSILMAYGYISLLVVFCRSNMLQGLKAKLANVGKMALTNYLSQTIICCFIFNGWGIGLYGDLERYQQFLVVISVWVILVTFSSYWLANYKFGPFEWLWRSLTYRKFQSMKLQHSYVKTEMASE